MAEFSSNGSDEAAGTGGNAGGEVITCKAAVVWGAGEPFKMEEIEVEPPQRMEVRLRILFTSICHTDLSYWKGENESQRAFPRILGHEAAGVVESVGEGVEGLIPGDRVVPVFNGECGGCRACQSAKTNICAGYAVDPSRSVMRADGRVRFHWVGPGGQRRPVYHFLNTSTFAEYTVIDSACLVKIAADAPLDRMCLLSCGISTGVGAAWNTANVEEGSTLAIFGLGAVGLAAAEGARLRGAARIIGVDINCNKFMKGKEMGITDFINPKECTKPLHEGKTSGDPAGGDLTSMVKTTETTKASVVTGMGDSGVLMSSIGTTVGDPMMEGDRIHFSEGPSSPISVTYTLTDNPPVLRDDDPILEELSYHAYTSEPTDLFTSAEVGFMRNMMTNVIKSEITGGWPTKTYRDKITAYKSRVVKLEGELELAKK